MGRFKEKVNVVVRIILCPPPSIAPIRNARQNEKVQSIHRSSCISKWFVRKHTLILLGSMYISGKLTNYPSPRPTFCPKWEVKVNVRLGEGSVISFPETYIDLIVIQSTLSKADIVRTGTNCPSCDWLIKSLDIVQWLKKRRSIRTSEKRSGNLRLHRFRRYVYFISPRLSAPGSTRMKKPTKSLESLASAGVNSKKKRRSLTQFMQTCKSGYINTA